MYIMHYFAYNCHMVLVMIMNYDFLQIIWLLRCSFWKSTCYKTATASQMMCGCSPNPLRKWDIYNWFDVDLIAKPGSLSKLAD